MKLEVGKRYKNGHGEIVEIDSKDGDKYCYRSWTKDRNTRRAYSIEGYRVGLHEKETLIEEVNEPKFKINDKVKTPKGVIGFVTTGNPYKVHTNRQGEGGLFHGVYNENELELVADTEYKASGTINNTHFMGVDFANTEDMKMEIKDMKKENLKAGKEQIKEERMNAEIEFAACEYRRITDLKDSAERLVKATKEKIDEYDKELKAFGGK